MNMDLRNLLFAAGTCVCMDATAQVTNGFALSMDTKLGPQLHKVEFGGLMKNPSKSTARDRAALGAVAVRPAAEAQAYAPREAVGKERLDSIVQANPDGSKSSLQYFVYNEAGKETHREISYWNASTNAWDEPTEVYDYEWNDAGLLVNQQGLAYGSGVRYEYKYNDQGLGIEQVNYQLGTDGGWEPVSKGEYVYDDQANIIEETTYAWNGEQWVPSVHNLASWDAKNRQTNYMGYTWDGAQGVGSERYEYVWFDGPIDPDMEGVEGIETDRMTYKGNFTWIDGQWRQYYFFTNEIREDGRLIGQSEHYYDRRSGKWCGGDDWDGFLGFYKTWKSRKTYNDRNHEVLSETWYCMPDSTGWQLNGASPTTWEYDGDGNRTGLFKLITYNYDAEGNLLGESFTQQTHYGYNAANKKTWVKEQLVAEDGTETTLFEEKYTYDDADRLLKSLIWDWVDGVRTPTSYTEYTYDADGNITELLSKLDASTGGGTIPLGVAAKGGAAVEPEDEEGWVNSTLWTYAYDNGTLVDKRGYMWRNEEWTTNTGQVVDYDFDVTSADACFPEGWQDPYKINWIDDLYADGSNGWMAMRRDYYYSENIPTAVGGVTADGVTGVGVSLSADMLSVTADGEVSVSIYGIDGTCVRTSCEKQVYVGDMPSGVYVVAVNGYKTKVVKN